MDNFKLAVIAIHDDPYYGFRPELGPVKSTKYKNLSWAARRLLVLGNGETTLNSYKGIPATAKYQVRLEKIIEDYLHIREAEDVVIPEEISDSVTAIKAEIMNWREIV